MTRLVATGRVVNGRVVVTPLPLPPVVHPLCGHLVRLGWPNTKRNLDGSLSVRCPVCDPGEA